MIKYSEIESLLKNRLNHNLIEKIFTDYCKQCFTENVISEIDKIKYKTEEYCSTLPVKPIRIYHTLLYAPDQKKLYRYLSSVTIGENSRSDKDLSSIISCNDCDFETAPQVENFRLKNNFTVPIFRYKRMCKNCIKCMRKKNPDRKIRLY